MKFPRPNACLSHELALCSTAHGDQMLNVNPAVTYGGCTLGEEVHNQGIEKSAVTL